MAFGDRIVFSHYFLVSNYSNTLGPR
jgi:hypothetical protein